MIEYNKLLKLFESFLNNSKNGCSENGQSQFNCPNCDNYSNKYNLEVNFRLGKFNCWSCGQTDNTYGKLSNLIKVYGNSLLLKQYFNEIKEIRNSKLYELKSLDYNFENEDFDEEIYNIPQCCQKIDKYNYDHRDAIEYLYSRGINDDLIKKYRIHCTTWCDDWKMKNRIVFPSYDKFGNLNYWVARYYGKSKSKYITKYYNMDIEKKDIIFNEKLIYNSYDSNIVLVEGVSDHIVTPNSVPLLGKVLKKDSYLYKEIITKCNGNIIIFLDGDAIKDVKNIYKLLNHGKLYNKIYYIPLSDNDLDPSKIYELWGNKGIAKFLSSASRFNDIELQFN